MINRMGRVTVLAGFCFLATGLAWASGTLKSLIPVSANGGMVVAGHPEAAEIGAAILESGGTAMDAVVATGFAVGVAEPYGSGIGGKCVILYYEAASGETWYIEGMDSSGSELDPKQLIDAGSSGRAEGALGVGVPGMVSAMELGHSRWGQMPWKELLEPSIKLALAGSAIVPGMRPLIEAKLERIRSNAECTRIYLPGGKLPEEGSRLPNPDLAWTMEQIAESGAAGFYSGKVARRIVEDLQSGGSHLTLEDFQAYRAKVREPLSIEWNGYTLITSGRPTVGPPRVLLSLKLLERVGFPDDESLRTAANLDLYGRVLRNLYPLIQANLADSEDYLRRWQELAGGESMNRLRKATMENRQSEEADAMDNPLEQASGWTTHFVVADKFGNVASVTQSLSHHFGSGVVPPGTGVVMNNSLTNFSYWENEPVNYVSPGKRPRSTISPTIVFRDGQPVLAIGLPGGSRIPTTLLAVLIEHLQFEKPLGEVIAAPRFHLRRSWSLEPDSIEFQFEKGMGATIGGELEQLGWTVSMVTNPEYFGGVTAISLEDNGRLTGWADWRRTNRAVGAERN
jgi:gamma-glutamyltranspeptidase/glutathione hydrolase